MPTCCARIEICGQVHEWMQRENCGQSYFAAADEGVTCDGWEWTYVGEYGFSRPEDHACPRGPGARAGH